MDEIVALCSPSGKDCNWRKILRRGFINSIADLFVRSCHSKDCDSISLAQYTNLAILVD